MSGGIGSGGARPWWHWATVVLAVGGVAATALLAALDHPHRAVLVLAATLVLVAGARLAIPGRPWFSSRSKWMDVVVLAGLGLLLWYFSPFTATMGIG
ncbi:DUF3017 domain-containing protein [Actinomyces culturomici]|uniref:DUF3017 domain-containing protein n=1 Tax=Actinomyces culturomici TaxID=1926276 RepID=UPI000E20B826|nr:DUF3017 domain-containing protein [Actinomyces culturomici]